MIFLKWHTGLGIFVRLDIWKAVYKVGGLRSAGLYDPSGYRTS